MEEINSIYNSEITCPVCNSKTEITKVRVKAVKLLHQDTDFCPYYEGENPMLYEAVVCSECGYGSHITTFEKINRYEKDKVKERITKKWIKRSFLGKRTLDQSLQAFKIVLLNLNESEALNSEIAKICMRIAWIYRYKEEKVLEKKFLEHALKHYKIAYHDEDLSQGKFDEFTCMYIIGELCKRLEYYDESVQWFSRLIMASSDPEKNKLISKKLIENTRELVHQVKELVAQKGKEA